MIYYIGYISYFFNSADIESLKDDNGNRIYFDSVREAMSHPEYDHRHHYIIAYV